MSDAQELRKILAELKLAGISEKVPDIRDITKFYHDKLTVLNFTIFELWHPSLATTKPEKDLLKDVIGKFNRFRHLRTLIVKGTNLSALPDVFNTMDRLRVLHFSGNELKSPHMLHLPPNLQKLYLEDNSINQIININHLTKLQSFSLATNQLETLPEKMSNLPLHKLNLKGNNFSEYPDLAIPSSRLQNLNLSGNELTALPIELNKLLYLERLILDSNKISGEDTPPIKLLSLTRLSIQANNLTQFPNTLELPELTKLTLNWNKLTSLPDSLIVSRNLQEIELQGNNLHAIPDFFSKFKYLKGINLDQNKIIDINQRILETENLEYLILHYNELPKNKVDQVLKFAKEKGLKINLNLRCNPATT